MTVLEAEKATVTVTAVGADDTARPAMGRRRTTDPYKITKDRQTAFSDPEDVLTTVGDIFQKIHNFSVVTRYALYVLPVAGLLAIPLALFDSIYSDIRIGNIRALGLCIWIEIIWLSLWVCKLIAQAVPYLFQAVCSVISTGIRKYSLVLMSLEIPLSLFMWSITAWATVPVIYCFDQSYANERWVYILRRIMLATIAVAGMFLVEKLLVRLISINYHRKQYSDKIRESKRTIHILDLMYENSRALFPPFCPEFEEEDGDIHEADIEKTFRKSGIRTKVFSDVGRVRDKVTAAFGNMASEITGKEVFNPTAAHSIVIGALETRRASKALARRLWMSFVAEGKDALFQQDLHDALGQDKAEEAEEIFSALDKDCNGDVSLEEMIMLVMEVAEERKNRAVSMHDISQAISVLDRLLGAVVIAGTALIYAAFFSASLVKNTTQLWSTFTGLGFAIGGTVTEFLACCIFLFVKHPYDVGDRVDVDGKELVVSHISLMYTVFRRVDSEKFVQISHSVLTTLWVENVTRSQAMKEQIIFKVSADTSAEDIANLRGELLKFVNAPDNKRDFQPDLNIELISVGDLKQLELRVEIKTKVCSFARLQSVLNN